MSAVRKLEYTELPQGFMPKSMPEIIKLAKNMKQDQGVVYHKEGTPWLFETERLIIRHFAPEDGEAVCVLAKDKESSPLAIRDHKWPTDLESCKGIAEFFSKNDTFWAVCIKPDFELIGLITYNSVDENNMVDLGHVWRLPFMCDELDTEALSLMVQYAFEKLKVAGVYAGNPLDYEAQIHPLKQIGMEITETGEASFVNDEQGNPITFKACKMVITREKWENTTR